jgi:hypothetical protein
LVAIAAVLSVGTVYGGWLPPDSAGKQVRVEIVEQNANQTVFDLFVPAVETTTVVIDGGEFTRLTILGVVEADLDTGRPELPTVPVLLAVPTGSSISLDVSVEEAETLAISSVYPLQPQPDEDEEPGPFVFDSSFYLLDTLYPGMSADLDSSHSWRRLTVASVQVYPVQVNPGDGFVVVATHMTVTVYHSDGTYPATVDDWMMPIYGSYVDNFSELSVTPDLGPQGKGHPRYLVMCHSAYASNTWLRDSLLGWVEQRGYEVKVDTGNWGPGDAAAIKGIIQSEYNASPSLHAVLLVGDNDDIPMGSCPNAEDRSDFYYADLDHDSLYPEVEVGRLSCLSTANLENQVKKILKYQRGPSQQNAWLTKLTLVAHKQREYTSCVRGVYSMPCTSYYHYQTDTVMGTCCGNQDLAEAVDSGRGIVIYRGHGAKHSWASWGTDGSWTRSDVQALSNGGMTPVVHGVCCSSGNISDDTCLAEMWMRKYPGGAVACIAASYFTKPKPNNGQCSTLVRALSDTATIADSGHSCRAPVTSTGDVLIYMDAYIAKYWPGDSAGDPRRKNLYLYLLLGDPSMPVWSGGTPETALVSYPETLDPGTSSVPVTVTLKASARPVAGARVCLQKEPDVYSLAVTDSNGYALLPLTNHGPGQLTVTVSEGHASSRPHTPILPFAGTIWSPGLPWTRAAEMPRNPSHRAVKAGGWLATDLGSGLIYGAKGNKTADFYSYDATEGLWYEDLAPIERGTEQKLPSKGCRGVCDGQGHVYMTKGNNTVGFWRYSVNGDSWAQLPDVPLGVSNKRVKDGSDLAFAVSSDTGYVYLLKGSKFEFYRFNCAAQRWETLAVAPGYPHRWTEGSFLVYDSGQTIYAHKAKYHEFYAYNVQTDSWSSPRAGIPFQNSRGSSRRSRDGGSGAWLNGCLYALKGGNTQEFWRYNPSTDSWHELDTLPLRGTSGLKKRVKAGGDIVPQADGSALYALKGNNTREFWRCAPSPSDGSGLSRGGVVAGIQPGRDDPPAEVAMSTDGIEAWSPRWNAQGTACCYVRESQGGIGAGYDQIYVRTAGAAGTEMMVTDARTDFAWPTFNPLGNMLACIVYDTISERDQVAVIPLAGGFGQEPSPQPQSDRNVVSASALAARSSSQGLGTATAAVTGVTPGRPQAALGHDPKRSGEIRSCPAAGGADNPVIQLTFDASDKGHVEWSPAGDWLVYEAEDEVDGYTEIRRIRWQGVEEQQLTADPAEHCLPQYLTPCEIVFQWSPNGDYDRLVRMNVDTREWRILTPSDRDYEQLCPSYWGDRICYVAQDEQGVDQIGVVGREGGDAHFITGDQFDKSEPDWSQDNMSIYAAQWYGLTSAIGWVSAFGSPFMPVTDGSAIRDNPDVAYMSILCQNAVIYERENVSPTDGYGPDQKLRKGTGIFLVRHRRPQDGAMTAGLVTELRRAAPNPATGPISVFWQAAAAGTDATVKVYDAAGRQVSVLFAGKAPVGLNEAVWRCRDQKGRKVATGVYFCTLETREDRISRKVVLTSSE